MLYQRPTVGAMQKWADDVEDQSWTWNNVLKYFARSSTFNLPPKSRPQNATPGYDESVFDNGPVQTSYSTYSSPVAGWFLKAAQALGLEYAAHGFQSGHLLGNGWTPSTVTAKTGVRSSSQEAYLQMGLETQNLTVYTHSLAKKLVFDGQKATGVQVATGQLPFTLTAEREVVVSCGAFQSPQVCRLTPCRVISLTVCSFSWYRELAHAHSYKTCQFQLWPSDRVLVKTCGTIQSLG